VLSRRKHDRVLCEARSHFCRASTKSSVPVAARSEAWVCGRAPAGIARSNPTGGMDVCPVQCLCCQVEVSAAERLLGSRVRIPPGAWMFVLYSVCVVR
jgi:hypothetical protein